MLPGQGGLTIVCSPTTKPLHHSITETTCHNAKYFVQEGYQVYVYLREYARLNVSEAAAASRKRQVAYSIASRLSRGRPLHRSH